MLLFLSKSLPIGRFRRTESVLKEKSIGRLTILTADVAADISQRINVSAKKSLRCLSV